MDFESRYHRFSNMRSMGLLNERLYGPILVKHAVYLMLAVLIGWRGLALGSEGMLTLAVAVALLGLASAVTGVKTVSLEVKILATLYSLFDSLTSRGGRKRSGEAVKEETGRKDASIKNELRAALSALYIPFNPPDDAPGSHLGAGLRASVKHECDGEGGALDLLR